MKSKLCLNLGHENRIRTYSTEKGKFNKPYGEP